MIRRITDRQAAQATAEPPRRARSATYRVEIPGWRPALLNEYVGRHWTRGAMLKKRDRWTVGVAVVAAGVPLARGRRRVTLTLVLGPRQRKCDPDAPWKSLLDALSACGAIRDDSARWCEMAPLRFERGEHLIAIVELEDLPPGDSRGPGQGTGGAG